MEWVKDGHTVSITVLCTAWKVSVFGVFSGQYCPYFPKFGKTQTRKTPNTHTQWCHQGFRILEMSHSAYITVFLTYGRPKCLFCRYLHQRTLFLYQRLIPNIIGPYHPALLDRASLITDKGTEVYPIISFFIKEKTNYMFSSFIVQDSFEEAYMILDPCICLRSQKKELSFNSRSCQS